MQFIRLQRTCGLSSYRDQIQYVSRRPVVGFRFYSDSSSELANAEERKPSARKMTDFVNLFRVKNATPQEQNTEVEVKPRTNINISLPTPSEQQNVRKEVKKPQEPLPKYVSVDVGGTRRGSPSPSPNPVAQFGINPNSEKVKPQKAKEEKVDKSSQKTDAPMQADSTSTALTFETGRGTRANLQPAGPMNIGGGITIYPRMLSYGDSQYEIRKKEILAMKVPKIVYVQPLCSLKELAEASQLQASDLCKTIIKLDEPIHSHLDPLDQGLIELVLSEYNMIPVIRENAATLEIPNFTPDVPIEQWKPRSPVVAIMGHINHGKTSLLDSLRKSNLTEDEAGGITQSMAAFNVNLPSGAAITFVDTPGHEAFSKMRSRSSKIVDITVIVVAGDEGVKEQSIEAIAHAMETKCPIIIAINKKDKRNFDSEKVKQQLLQHSIIPVDYGGEVHCVDISAKQGEGMEELEDAILLVASDLELRTNPSSIPTGHVIDAKMDRGRGSMGMVLLQQGNMKVGQCFVSGISWGRIKSIYNDKGQAQDEVGPSTPVTILGAKEVMNQGDDFMVVNEERRAKELAKYRRMKQVQTESRVQQEKERLEAEKQQAIERGEDVPEVVPQLNLILKAGSAGSLEALHDGLSHLPQNKVQIRVVRGGVGNLTESDIKMAEMSNSTIVTFNSVVPPLSQQSIREKQMHHISSKLIYTVFDGIRERMIDCLEPTILYTVVGTAQVLQIFDVGKRNNKSTIAGCRVVSGSMSRKFPVRVMRGDEIIHQGKIDSLKHHKDSIAEVKPGMEFGMSIHKFGELQAGDIIQTFSTREVRPSLE